MNAEVQLGFRELAEQVTLGAFINSQAALMFAARFLENIEKLEESLGCDTCHARVMWDRSRYMEVGFAGPGVKIQDLIEGRSLAVHCHAARAAAINNWHAGCVRKTATIDVGPADRFVASKT